MVFLTKFALISAEDCGIRQRLHHQSIDFTKGFIFRLKWRFSFAFKLCHKLVWVVGIEPTACCV